MIENQQFIRAINNNIKIFSKLNKQYKEKIKVNEVKDKEDFLKLPFMEREDLQSIKFINKNKYVRIHSTSGTTGQSLIIPYTKKDVDDWTTMMCRCYKTAGIDENDIIQIATGYGLWTAGIGFQLGCEKLGAMAVPIGCDNTEKQFEYLSKLKSTVICATSSYGIYLSDKVDKNKLYLKKGIFGSEIWGDKSKKYIEKNLNIKCYDIYGMTEAYGPGIAINCDESKYMHYWDDYFYFEIIDPITGDILPNGEFGELVITSLKKEGLPLIRYRTHDITRIINKKCKCGSLFPQIDQIVGRSDDMIKYHGVKIFPKQFEYILNNYINLSSKYEIILKTLEKRDVLYLRCELNKGVDNLEENIISSLKGEVKNKIGVNIEIIIESHGTLPQNIGKTKHVFDFRKLK